jgi:hypothetical protein
MEVSEQFHSPAALPTDTHWVGGWVGPGAVLNAVEKRKFVVMLYVCSCPVALDRVLITVVYLR